MTKFPFGAILAYCFFFRTVSFREGISLYIMYTQTRSQIKTQLVHLHPQQQLSYKKNAGLSFLIYSERLRSWLVKWCSICYCWWNKSYTPWDVFQTHGEWWNIYYRQTPQLVWKVGFWGYHQSHLHGGFIFFFFDPYLGKWSNLTNIYQMGCNHQLDMFWPVPCSGIPFFVSYIGRTLVSGHSLLQNA